ncbi:MAG: NAD(P)/FAD-dependent oxidoreductase [Cyanobacteriota bacterium]|nr:NAD(P)/FAD-dependent oxidoreductase [Cyanobacteriota bacterium]
MARPQVIVVGGGPCGFTLGLALARAGWGVTLVEQAASGAPRPYRGEGLMPSGLAALEALGLWPLPASVRHRPLAGWAVALDGRSLFTAPEPLGGDQGCWLVEQPSLLDHLRARLEREEEARVLEGVAVRGLLGGPGVPGVVSALEGGGTSAAGADCAIGAAAGGDSVLGAVAGRDSALGAAEGGDSVLGAAERVAGVVVADGQALAADLVVACDGRSSPLRRLAGLELAAEGVREGLGENGRAAGGDAEGETVLWFRLAGSAVAPLARWLAGRFLTAVGEGVSFALFAEASDAALRLGWVAEPGVAPPADASGWREAWAAALPAPAAALMRTLPLTAIEGPRRFPVRVGWAPVWHRPGLLLLGDAAHPMRPVRAQGINMALRDALVAARLLGPLATGPDHPSAGASIDDLHAAIDGCLPRVAAARLPEIRSLQELQAREAGLGALLRQVGLLRRTLALSAPWSGPLVRARWIQRQHRLRQGLPGALPLPK